MVPVHVVASRQLMVAMKALGGSTPLPWVNVATATLFTFLPVMAVGPDTTIGASATAVVVLALLFAVLGSGMLLVTEPLSLRLPSSVDRAATVKLAVPPLTTVPSGNVTTTPDC